jgi:hypothetical protein
VRGLSPGVVGNDNLIAGRGFQPIDTRGGAGAPTFRTTDISGWQHRTSLSVLASLRYHPLLATWLVILVFIIISSILVRFRRAPYRPYRYSVAWRPTTHAAVNGNGFHQEVLATVAETTVVAAAEKRRRQRRRSLPLEARQETSA